MVDVTDKDFHHCLRSGMISSLCCPECGFNTTSAFDLRKHIMTFHLESSSRSLELHVFTCSVCGVSTTDQVQIKDHLQILHSNDLKPTIMAQRIVLGICGADDFHCSSESDCECDEAISNASAERKDRNSRSLPSTLTNEKSSSKVTYSLSSLSTNGIMTPDSNQKLAVSPKSDQNSPGKQSRAVWQDWSKLITRSDKKFICLVCKRFIYSGRTEVVFHAVTRHLLAKEIESDLSQYGRLTEQGKRQIGRYFSDGMRIRSGVHYKDAKRVEAALFRSIELHLRYQPISSSEDGPEKPTSYICSGCNASFSELQVAYAHVNDELRAFLPEFMRARSCPWSLSTREEWVWIVPDLPVKPLPGKSVVVSNNSESNNQNNNTPNAQTPVVLTDRIFKIEQPDNNSTQSARLSATTTTPAITITVANSSNNNNNNRIDSTECITIPTISPCSLTTVSGFLPVPIMSIHPGSTFSFAGPTLEFTPQTLQPSQSIIPISCILTTNPLS
ncbi:unnamed protein product [Heterobilharzia americana]|nr:unnamed protein product [Heterobilharzia americana]